MSSSILDRKPAGSLGSSTAPTPERSSMSTWEATRLVAGREISVKLRDRAFLFSSAFMLVLVAAFTVLPAMFSGGPSRVAVVGAAAQQAATAIGAEVTVAPDRASAEAMVRGDDVDAALVSDDGGETSGLAVIALSEAPDDLVSQLSVSPPVQLLEPSDTSPALAFLVPFTFAIDFFLTSLTFGLSISQSVVEEKQTRIVEILVAAMPVRALLAGKVLGNTVLALGQIVLIAGIAVIGLTFSGSAVLTAKVLSQLGVAMVWFLPFFLIGFLMLAGLWAVSGALVSRIEDLGSTTTPVQLLIMLPFFAVISGGSNPP